MKNQGMQKSAERLYFALQHCHRCFECSMPLIFCSIHCCAQKEAKSLPQNIKGCENQNVFSLEDAKSLANSQSDLRNMEMVTLDLESRKLWIQNILNLSTFQISHPTVSDIPIACVTSVSPLKGNFREQVIRMITKLANKMLLIRLVFRLSKYHC